MMTIPGNGGTVSAIPKSTLPLAEGVQVLLELEAAVEVVVELQDRLLVVY